jgi:phage terminase Nu1 subunit (DNA packaging protein)
VTRSTSTTLPVMRAQAVRLLGLKDRTFARLEAEGILTATKRGTGRQPSEYDAFTLVPAYLAHQAHKLTGSLESPRDRAYLAQAKLAEFRLARERRHVLPREEYIRHGQQLAAAFTAQARNLPNRLVRAGVLTSAQEPEALAAVDEMLRNIARWSDEQVRVAAEAAFEEDAE